MSACRITFVCSPRLLTFWIAMILCIINAQAVPAQDEKIFQMVHTVWTARDGAPQSINSLAQTADGTLWFGTRDGLYSFDGVTFSVFHPISGTVPRKNVQHVFAEKHGYLWAFGGPLPPTRIRDGVATVFKRVDRGTFESLASLQQDSDGTVWGILNGKDLVRLGTDGVWHVAVGPKPSCDSLGPSFFDSSGTQWIVADDILYRRSRGEEKFTSTRVPVYGGWKFEEGRDHSIWIVSGGPAGGERIQPAGQPPVVALMHVTRLGKRLPNPPTRQDVSDVVVGADGSVWLSHVDGGLQRLQGWEISGQHPKGRVYAPDLFGPSDGLTTTGFRALLRDHDGGIWVAGGRGLDRFQPATMVPIVKNAIGGWWSVCASPTGDIWLAVEDGYRAVFRDHHLIRLKDWPGIMSILCEKGGRVLLPNSFGIAALRNGRIVQLPLLPAHGLYWEHYKFSSVVILPDDRLIASTVGPTENRLWIYRNHTWTTFLPSAGITQIRAMMLSRDNKLYLGSEGGRITVLRVPGYHAPYSAGTAIGQVQGFSETSYGIFAFGENGIALDRNNTLRMLSFSDPDLATSVTGLVEDRKGNIWINGSRAIARIASREIAAAIANPSHQVSARDFHEGDYRGSDIFAYSRNSAQIDTQGRLWFATANGVIYIDPKHLSRPSYPPALSIRAINADGRPMQENRTFPPEVQTLNIRYFGLNLSNPTGVVYRYKLEGSDTGWQNVGTRTEAIYTNPGPGRYIFEFEASNGNGAWTAPLDSAPFRIQPAFHQTWWFDVLCIAAGVLLLWAGLTLRLRTAAAAIRSRAEERAEERIRIARELHDTLLQGVQGLLLSFHAAAARVPANHESKKALDKALTAADRVILDGRDRINRLRAQHLSTSELEPAIASAADDLSGLSQTEFAVERSGALRVLLPEIVDEIFYIAREGLTNSFRHSGATRITVTLDYGKHQFMLTCRDNGRGFGADELKASEARGHWGLRGMAERADWIGAEFDYESAPGKGTSIRVRVPANRAYLRPHGFKFHFRRRSAA
jgi:signal transduction histidine kinase